MAKKGKHRKESMNSDLHGHGNNASSASLGAMNEQDNFNHGNQMMKANKKQPSSKNKKQ